MYFFLKNKEPYDLHLLPRPMPIKSLLKDFVMDESLLYLTNPATSLLPTYSHQPPLF
ncbi:uncharacterized protein G2W53_006564 [Senna tora]|uniref:Uncharacterized protein n=1 Tax=Senna tora TaxID=362788 RepID=A0A835CGL5_9FABA|nr:uncharacterized protein G2W53_006564 [Senna tora]